MIARSYSDVRSNLKEYCDRITNDFETVIVTRERGENVVMISESEYNNIMENLKIMGNSKQYLKLLKSKEQLNTGKGKTKELIEVEDE